MTKEELKLFAVNRSNELRNRLSKSEHFLWDKLKVHNKRFDTQWRCQVPIFMDEPVRKAFNTKVFYIADFVEMNHRIIIEVDGSHHSLDKYKDEDTTRDTALSVCGFKTYRITTFDVWRRAVLKDFLDKIYNTEALSPWYA